MFVGSRFERSTGSVMITLGMHIIKVSVLMFKQKSISSHGPSHLAMSCNSHHNWPEKDGKKDYCIALLPHD